jgi:oligopeptide transport system substrate-binding protein
VLFQTQSKENNSAYSNPAVDAALKEAAVEQDSAKRLQMYQDIEKMILNDLPIVPFYTNETEYVLVKPYLKGVTLDHFVSTWTSLFVEPH